MRYCIKNFPSGLICIHNYNGMCTNSFFAICEYKSKNPPSNTSVQKIAQKNTEFETIIRYLKNGELPPLLL